MRTRIRGKDWTVGFEGKFHQTLDGDCCWRTRKIRVFLNELSQYDPETVVHELLHAIYPKMCEDEVLRGGEELTNALCEIGIRFQKGLVRGNQGI